MSVASCRHDDVSDCISSDVGTLPLSTSAGERDRARRRAFITRREHTKSRGGCSFCKQRKVKCSETRPTCELCSAKGLICEYPRVQPSTRRRVRSDTPVQALRLLQPVPTTFSMSDLRLFHHFILQAHPHHPLGNETVWVQEVPTLAHHYDFLMHAMLALAASNLTAISNVDFTCAALSHRVRAVRSLKSALGQQTKTANDADAMLAAFFVFGFQALYMDDGLVDFLIMIRGCALVAGQIQSERLHTIFQFPTLASYVESMENDLDEFPLISSELAVYGSNSLHVIKPLCTKEVELLTHNLLYTILVQMQSSSTQAYSHFMALYTIIAGLSYVDFLYFTDPSNETMQLLLGYFVALHVIAGPIIMQEGLRSKKLLDIRKTRKWLNGLIVNIRPENLHYLEWPMAVAKMDELSGIANFLPMLEDEKTPIPH